MTEVTLVLDSRERGLAAELTDEAFVSVALDCGDVEIRIDSRPWLVLERKTLPDLAQSIKDGRYREQKLRLASLAPTKLGYVFEGGLSWSCEDACVGGLPRSTLQTATINSMFRDGMYVVMTRDVKDTADFVRQLLRRVRNNPDVYINGKQAQSAYSQFVVCAKKGANLTPRTTFVMQMRQIPGVADKAAAAICGVWPDMRSLCASATREEIADIRLSPGGRKVGQALAARICDHMGIV